MKTVITAVALAIALSSTAVMARDGGDTSKATAQEQQSFYYIIQKQREDAAKAQK